MKRKRNNVFIDSFDRAERVLAQWEELVERSAKVYHSLNEDTQPAYFELVYMLCLMQYNLNKMYIAGKHYPLKSMAGVTDKLISWTIESIRFPSQECR